ncbi:MAG: hypothetical protein HY890_04190 [Deltaproteobacteria bacterium]|nr:hypothetical protein [Deltaproteobacteria bacterium]
MGDENQLIFIRKNAGKFEGPFLEVGSRDYGSTRNLRAVFYGKGDYVGVDMSAGKGVDFVVDLAGDFGATDKALGGRRFKTIFCLSVLEHCEQPFKMAENLSLLIEPGGRICVSVPFAWKFHGYPSDYWRFTREGVKKLFPNLIFTAGEGGEASSRDNEFFPVSEDTGRIDFRGSLHRRSGHWLRGLNADIFKMLAGLGLFRWVFGYPYVLRPTIIYMIGESKAAG